MISAEQARQNVERHKAQVSEAKRQRAEIFIKEVVEPAICAASMEGKSEINLNFHDYHDVASEVVGMIHEAGFQTERGRSDDAIRITWYADGTPTRHNTLKAVVVLP